MAENTPASPSPDLLVHGAETLSRVTVDAYNGPFGRNRGATREATVLDVAQLTAIAEDPRWGLTMESSFVTAAESTVLSLQ